MKAPYLEVTYRHSQQIAAYLYLTREAGERSCRTFKAAPGMLVDFAQSGNAIGIEMTAPATITVTDINRILRELGIPLVTGEDLAPLRRAA